MSHTDRQIKELMSKCKNYNYDYVYPSQYSPLRYIRSNTKKQDCLNIESLRYQHVPTRREEIINNQFSHRFYTPDQIDSVNRDPIYESFDSGNKYSLLYISCIIVILYYIYK